MNSFDSATNLWDFSQATDYNTLGQLGEEQFLDLLQKQFSQEFNPVTPVGVPPDGVDPSKLTSLPAPNPPPPLSTDSSPSPSSINENSAVSRRQSASFEPDESHKRKSMDDNLDEGPSHKTSKKNPPRRKGAAGQDDGRLQKRKEQNRAAQRAFRERKEKHVKDLEEKVAALEAKNETTETENQHLRELLKRLQDENVMLKQAQFTFTVPKPTSESQPFNNVATTTFGSTPNSAFGAGPSSNAAGSSPSTSGSTPQSSSLDTPSNFPSDIDFGTLTSFDTSQLNLLDENGDTNMSYDFGFGQIVPSNTPYKTIASNTMFMSFAEPSPPNEFGAGGDGNKSSPPSGAGSPFDSSFNNGWPGPGHRSDAAGARTGSFDELFGGHMFGSQSPMSPASFTSLMNGSGSTTISPVLHARSSPSGTISNQPSPDKDASSSAPGTQHSQEQCPKTKQEFEQMVNKGGSSVFAPMSSPAETIPAGPGAVPALHKALSGDGAGPMIMCKGASFPPTEKREDNVEVLAAWRSITSHPHFKASNIDINELCAEFTDKARCDGTKIVLDKNGVSSIIGRLTQKYAAHRQGAANGVAAPGSAPTSASA